MNIEKDFSSQDSDTYSNDVMDMAMGKIATMLIKPMQNKLTQEQDALLAIDEGDGTPTRGGIGVAGIEAHQARLTPEGRQIDASLTLRPLDDGKLQLLPIDSQCRRLSHRRTSFQKVTFASK